MTKFITKSLLAVAISITAISCTNTKMVSCPDYKADKSILARNSNSYKPSTYKAPKVSNKYTKVDFVKAEAPISDINNTEIEVVKILEPTTVNAVAHITPELNISKSREENVSGIIDDLAKEDLALANNLSASSASIKIREKVSPESNKLSSVEEEVINDVVVLENPAKKVSRSELRKERRKMRSMFRESFERLTHMKPAMGMAIASFVLSIIGLIIFPLLMGILGLIFGSVAVSRIAVDPGQPGRGMAIAGIVIGMIDIIWVLIVVSMAL